MRQQTLALVRELLGPEATEVEVQFCEISTISIASPHGDAADSQKNPGAVVCRHH